MNEDKIKAVEEFLQDNFEFKEKATLHGLWQNRYEGAARVLVNEVIAEIEALEALKKKKGCLGGYFAEEYGRIR